MSLNRLAVARRLLSRRSLMKVAGLSLVGSGWFRFLDRVIAAETKLQRHCILLWMAGGPSQIDTFDMKPRHANGGEFQEISTSVPGLKFSEHLPRLATCADRLAIVRSVSTKEGDHARGTYLVRTGQRPGADLKYPAIGSALAKALGDRESRLPAYFSFDPFVALNPDAYSSGFLGPEYAAAAVSAREPEPGAFAELTVENLGLPPGLDASNADARREVWQALQAEFIKLHPGASPLAHDTAYRRAFRMMDSEATAAFDLSQESVKVRESYGRGSFGQSCLAARRLIERGVPLIEITLGGANAGGLGWDTHVNNFEVVKQLSSQLDAGWAALMDDLQDRALLDRTTILCIGEFGRTPVINDQGGRDHFPGAWSCVFAGGGIKGGQAYGRTTEDGREVAEDPVDVADLLATLCHAVGVDPNTENYTADGRPVRISEGEPIQPILIT